MEVLWNSIGVFEIDEIEEWVLGITFVERSPASIFTSLRGVPEEEESALGVEPFGVRDVWFSKVERCCRAGDLNSLAGLIAEVEDSGEGKDPEG